MDVSTTVFTLPSGIVLAYAAATAPSGYLLCDGSAVSRNTYAGLFATIGTTHGQGDGSSTFNLPDYRGRFLRGVDGGMGRDPDAASRTPMNTGGNSGANVGSIQGHQYASHTHTQDPHSHGIQIAQGSNSGFPQYPTTLPSSSTTTFTSNSATATNQNSGGNETRPVNAYVAYIIKT